MSSGEQGWRERSLRAVADFGLKRSGSILVAFVVILAVSGWFAAHIGVTSSRTGLVGDDDPSWQRLSAFYEEFGRPSPFVFVVQGGTAEQRRTAVDALERELATDDDFRGRMLGRLQPDLVAPLLLLQQPDALAQLRARMPASADLPAIVEGGIPKWMSTLEEQVYAGLDGAENPDPSRPAPTPEQAAEGLRQLAMLAKVLDDVLAGADPLEGLMAQAGDAAKMPASAGLDDRGYTVTGDGERHLLSVFAELPSDEADDLEPIVERIDAARQRAAPDIPEGVEVILTGMPKFIVEELDVISESTMTSSVATALGVALLCLLLFRSVVQMIIALIPLLPGVVVTFAFIQLAYENLNLITSSFIAALLGLGIDFSVHALARFHEERRAGASPDDAVRRALVYTGPGIATGAVVTIAAFLTTTTTDFSAFGELGLITSVGLAVVVIATFTLMPTLLSRLASEKSRPSPEFPGLSALGRLLSRLKRPLLVIGVALGAAGGYGLTTIDWNARYFDFLPDDTESARGLAALEYDALASPVFANLSADDLPQARAMTEQLRALDSVAGVQTPTDLLPELSPEQLGALKAGFAGLPRDPDFAKLAQRSTKPDALADAATGVADALDEASAALTSAGRDATVADQAAGAFKALAKRAKTLDEAGAARLAGLEAAAAGLLGPAWTTGRAVAERGGAAPTDLPSLFAERFVSPRTGRVALYVVPAGDFWDRDVARGFAEDVLAVDGGASGLALDHVSHGDLVLDGFLRAAVIAAVLILVLLIGDFGGPRDALLALLPTVLGWLWMFGAMALFGIPFNVANIVCLPLVLGIGVAFGVHFMHRVREDADGSLDTVLRGTGGAIAVAALTTMVGFAGLMLGRYGAQQSFGLVMVIGIATCLAATIAVLPATLVLLGRLK